MPGTEFAGDQDGAWGRSPQEKGEGREEGREEIARNLKKIGVPLEQILQGTGLSAEEIARL
jgi:predicted transposase YdaD